MVDATQATESRYLTAELVRQSPSKKLVILGPGKYEETNFGMRLTLPVSLDKKEKFWRVNTDSAKNLSSAWSSETLEWVGKVCRLRVMSIQGKDSVIAEPVQEVLL